ncbi:MAG: hypothetical protein ACOH2L_06795 [Devosia sp.]
MVEPIAIGLRLIATLALTVLLTACVARPTGDFGRAEPSIVHDTMMPFVGDRISQLQGVPVSGFNKTDQEVEMQDRVWRFLIAPHAQDWLYDMSVELQRTHIVPPKDDRYSPTRYYTWLKRTDYQSSRTRYSTVGEDATIDIETLPSTFAAICAVIEVDRQRALALAGLRRDLPPSNDSDVAARKYENDAYIAWFVRALNYRYDSYHFALDSLVVETPHEQSLGVDDALQRLNVFVGRANRHDFCGDGIRVTARGTVALPSRFQHTGDNEVVLLK